MLYGLIQCLSNSSSSVTADLIFSAEYRIIVPARTEEARMTVGEVTCVPTNDIGLVWPFIIRSRNMCRSPRAPLSSIEYPGFSISHSWHFCCI